MTIQLNGESREIPDGLSLARLVEWLELPADRIAIERNLEVVKRTNWNETLIEKGDRLEIVRMVGGGSACSMAPKLRSRRCIPR